MLWRAAFYGTNYTGVHSPWRFGNLNNGTAIGGLAYENGNNAPSSAVWFGVPWITDFIIDP